MYWRYGGSFFGTMTQTNRYVKSYRNPKLQFAVSQPIWLEGEAKFADIILPACTNFERWDISEFASCSGYIPDSYTQTNNRVFTLQKKCIEPLGESKSDYEIFAAVCDRLGVGDLFTMGGKDEYQWTKEYFHATDLPKYISWEEFEKKGYFVLPFPKEHKSTPAMRWFAEDRVRDTPDWGPHPGRHRRPQRPPDRVRQDRVRVQQPPALRSGRQPRSRAAAAGPAVHPQLGRAPHHGAVRQVSAAAGLAAPAVQLPHHGRRQGQLDERGQGPPGAGRTATTTGSCASTRRTQPLAASRAATLIRAFNDRGSVILAAQVTERAPGTVHSYESCAEYDPLGVPGESPDRGGCVNILTNIRLITPYSGGMSNNSCLIQVEKWEGAQATGRSE